MCVTNTAFLRHAQQQRLSVRNQQQHTQSKCGSTERGASLSTRISHLHDDNTAIYSVSSGPYFSAPQHDIARPVSSDSLPQKPFSDALKSRPKRRRPPQKPGKTAKMNDRRFVEHNYHDHLNDVLLKAEVSASSSSKSRKKDCNSNCFTLKLHKILEQAEQRGLTHICSWQPHGRCFVIHDPKAFASLIMPEFFRHSKLTSFQRQLNLYGFNRLTTGADNGGYYHELFLRARPMLSTQIARTKVKGAKFRAASNPDQEPDLYSWPSASGAVVTPPHSPPQSPLLVAAQVQSYKSCSSVMIQPAPSQSTFLQDKPYVESTTTKGRQRNFDTSLMEPNPFPEGSSFVPQEKNHENPSFHSMNRQYDCQEMVPSSMGLGTAQDDWITNETVDEIFLPWNQIGQSDGLVGDLEGDLDDRDDFVSDMALGSLIDRMLQL